jgi:sialate O-acetylesterase
MAALRRRWLAALALLLGACSAQAELRLAGIFGEHMVLQRGQPLRVWGWAEPGEPLTLQLAGQRVQGRADAQGRWQLRLPPLPAGGPHELRLQGRAQVLRVADVLIGEVWFAAGQSNMEWALADSEGGAAAAAAAADPLLRHVKLPHRLALQPLDDSGPLRWEASTAQSAPAFSAVAYHHARRLREALGVPVGIVNVSWGGSPLEAWMSPRALQAQPELRRLLPALPRSEAEFAERYMARQRERVRRWQGDEGLAAGADTQAWADPALNDSRWPQLQAPGIWEGQGLDGFDGRLWYRKTLQLSAAQAATPAATLELAMVDDCDESFVNGQRIGGLCGWDVARRYALPPGLLHEGANVIAVRVRDDGGGGGIHGRAEQLALQLGDERLSLAGAWRARIEAPLAKSSPGFADLPGLIWNGMLAPLAGYGLRGWIWYQGESNVDRAAQYERSFPAFIDALRRDWGQADSPPFLFVQLAAFLPLADNSLQGSRWAELREAQARTLQRVPRSAMVVTTDVGDEHDIHPRNKRAVGERLAAQALTLAYGHKGASADGPRLLRWQRHGAEARLRFAARGGPLRTREGAAELQGFSVAGQDRVFVAAPARIAADGRTVIVRHPQGRPIAAVRYGWVDNPAQSNLVDAASLPASPLRTDRWPRLTEAARYEF